MSVALAILGVLVGVALVLAVFAFHWNRMTKGQIAHIERQMDKLVTLFDASQKANLAEIGSIKEDARAQIARLSSRVEDINNRTIGSQLKR